ncbi:MAG: hypothetical protein ACI9BW_003233 [Gammaproteobacteria bacterium]|jgi:hypothetical protein
MAAIGRKYYVAYFALIVGYVDVQRTVAWRRVAIDDG